MVAFWLSPIAGFQHKLGSRLSGAYADHTETILAEIITMNGYYLPISMHNGRIHC